MRLRASLLQAHSCNYEVEELDAWALRCTLSQIQMRFQGGRGLAWEEGGLRPVGLGSLRSRIGNPERRSNGDLTSLGWMKPFLAIPTDT